MEPITEDENQQLTGYSKQSKLHRNPFENIVNQAAGKHKSEDRELAKQLLANALARSQEPKARKNA